MEPFMVLRLIHTSQKGLISIYSYDTHKTRKGITFKLMRRRSLTRDFSITPHQLLFLLIHVVRYVFFSVELILSQNGARRLSYNFHLSLHATATPCSHKFSLISILTPSLLLSHSICVKSSNPTP